MLVQGPESLNTHPDARHTRRCKVVKCACTALSLRGSRFEFRAPTRRAATYLLASILDTCDASDIFPLDDLMRLIRSSLTRCIMHERDLSTRIHNKRAVARLDVISKSFFFPH